MGALGSSFSVGSSTDSPPTPESKNRIGAETSTRHPPRHLTGRGTARSAVEGFFRGSGSRCDRELRMLPLAAQSRGGCVAPPLWFATHLSMTREMLFALGLGYLLGSIPFGLLLTRLARKGDIRDIGSGNTGATNLLRTGSRPLAALTLILDCLKATAAILLSMGLFRDESAAAAATRAKVRHLYPVWLRFRGGKGVATLLGVLIPLLPIAAGISPPIWLLLLPTF